MNTILDELFRWAAQQPSGNHIFVSFTMTTNETTRNNLVSFAEGELRYIPTHFAGMFSRPSRFVSDPAGVTQYFSDRRQFAPGALSGPPFDPANTDPLSVSIVQESLPSGYRIALSSSKWGFTESFVPSFDSDSSILYGTVGRGLVTVSLCGWNSVTA